MTHAAASATTSTSWRPPTCSPTWTRSARSTGALPTDRTIVLQRFRDELGDWRICLLTPFGARVHAPWALAIEARLRETPGRRGAADLVRRRHRRPPAGDRRAAAASAGRRELGGDGRRGRVGRRRRWRPRRRPCCIAVGRGRGAGRRRGRRLGAVRQPLPRERGAGAAAAAPPSRAAARRSGRCASARRSCSPWPAATVSFPIILETYRECLQDVFDLPALREHPGRHRAARDPRRERRDAARVALRQLAAVRLHRRLHVRGRRAAASTGGRRRWRSTATCCASCWAPRSCASCSMREALAELELELQALTAGARRGLGRRRSTTCCVGWATCRAEEVADAGPRRGRAGARPRRRGVAGGAGRGPARGRRCASPASRAGSRPRTPAATGTRVGVAPPRGRAGGVPGADPRCARRAAGALGAAPRAVPGRRARRRAGACRGAWSRPALERLMAAGRAAARRVPARRRGARVVRPGGPAAAPAALAGAAAPRDRAGRAARRWRASCPRWQGVGERRGGHRTGWPRSSPSWRACRCRPASWSATSCRRASRGYQPRLLDELGAAGEVVWVGAGSLGRDDGRVAL